MPLTQTQVIQIKFNSNFSTLEAEIKTSNGRTIRKSEPVNRNKPRSNEKPRSNPRELEAPCLSVNPDNSNSLNIASLVSNNLTPREKLASLLEKIRTRGFDSMLGVESVEAKSCYDGWKNARESTKEIRSETGEVLGKNGARIDINARIEQNIKIKFNGKEINWRVDLENANPGVRPANIHIQGNGIADKLVFDPTNKALYIRNIDGIYELAPKNYQNLLSNPSIQKGINKALDFLVEPLIDFK